MDDFTHFISGGDAVLRGMIRTGWEIPGGDLPALCRELDGDACRLLKNRPKIIAGAVAGVFIKRYNLPDIITRLRRRFKTPRPEHARRAAHRLEELGIATPQVLAALTEDCGLRRREILITRLLPPDARFFNQISRETPADEAWPLIRRHLLPLLPRLHDAGCFHGDLSLRNLYLLPDGTPGLLDLDGMKLYRSPLNSRRRAREIARIVSSFMICRRDRSRCDEWLDDALTIYAANCSRVPSRRAVSRRTGKFLRRYRHVFPA